MKAAEWIDRVKKTRQIDSDYAAAKTLGLSRGTVSKYRTGTTPTLDEDSALSVAAALDIPGEAVLLDQFIERTKNPAARSALSRMAREALAGSVHYVK